MSGIKRVVVGMSGGVDSSVTAALLKEQGYEVIGLFMKNWEEEDAAFCPAERDREDAQRVCDHLQIELKSINFASEYWDNVFEHFLEGYRQGITPNPDILCNREIKFKVFWEYARHLGADAMATGHYARITRFEDKLWLSQGVDPQKDQSYFLYTLGADRMPHVLMPCGDYYKTEIRAIADRLSLATSHKKDSTGICFIGEKRFKHFLQRYLGAQKGLMRTPEGRVVGTHDGLMYYTLGQRQGLGLGGQKDNPDPWYVLHKDLAQNCLYVGQGRNHPWLLSQVAHIDAGHWPYPAHFPLRAYAKTRYRQQAEPCVVEPDEQGYRVRFDKPQWAVTPGQACVFYDQEGRVLGGGTLRHHDAPIKVPL